MRALRVLLLTLIAAAPAAVHAQDVYAQGAAAPSHIAFVEGSATVFHAEDDSEPAVVNMPIVQGDRIQTMGRSRVEVVYPDGGSIVIDQDSDVEFVTTTRVRVLAGGIEHRAAARVDPRSPSAQNLPPDLQQYGPQFDQYGAWQYEPQYGNVWYPTAVGPDWRPYYDGYWSSYPSYGWTWIGYERWAWPTHHYGRWGYARNRWFWIPGRSFAAAWVSWGTAPDYVSWCPLGYDGRPVVALSIGFRNSWNAWTVIPRDRFGSRGYSYRRWAVEPRRIAATTAFIEHRNPPTRRGSFTVGSRESAVYGRQSSVGGRESAVYGRQSSVGSRESAVYGRQSSVGGRDSSVGTAVPRDEYRRGSADYSRRGGDGRATPAPAPGGDHPAYQPQYAPRYAPRYEPRSEAPAERAQPQPGYRDRRAGQPSFDGSRPNYGSPGQPSFDGSRPNYGSPGQPSFDGSRPNYGSPGQPSFDGSRANTGSAPSPPPRVEHRSEPRASAPAAPAPSERQSSTPAREPHGGRDGAPGQSSGTAVRRPR